jgi:hypothetical protein
MIKWRNRWARYIERKTEQMFACRTVDKNIRTTLGGLEMILISRIDPFLGNDSANIYRRKRTRATIGRPLPGYRSVNKPS